MKFKLFPFAFAAGKVVADEGWPVTLWVDTHPLNFVGVMAVEPLRLGDLELAQHGLQILVAMDDFFHLHEIINKKYD